jgi:hypothetical protein
VAVTLDIPNNANSSDPSFQHMWIPRWDVNEEIDSINAQFYQLLDCYYLGTSLQAECFGNYIMDRIIDLAEWRTEILMELQTARHHTLAITGTHIHKLYQRTSKESPLRQFILEYHLKESGCHLLDAESLMQIIGRRRGRTPNYYDRPQCRFHIHSAEFYDIICTQTVL